MHEKDIWLLAFALALSAVCVVCWLQWRLAHFALCFVWRDADLRSSYAWLLVFAAIVVVTAGLGTMCGTVIATLPFWLGTLAAYGKLTEADEAVQRQACERRNAEHQLQNALATTTQPGEGVARATYHDVERDRTGRVLPAYGSRRIYPFVVVRSEPSHTMLPPFAKDYKEPSSSPVVAPRPSPKAAKVCVAKASRTCADKKKIN